MLGPHEPLGAVWGPAAGRLGAVSSLWSLFYQDRDLSTCSLLYFQQPTQNRLIADMQLILTESVSHDVEKP